ncbi:MAG: pyridoxal phosphate-dependent aminotransferase [Chitinophagaceae bacterium]
MATNRRNWLKNIGIGLAGLSLQPLQSLAADKPLNQLPFIGSDNKPIRLNFNENPYGPSPLAQKAMMEAINISNRYNWGNIQQVINLLAQKNKVSNKQVLMSAGSTDMLDLVARYAAANPGNMIVANPTFAFWTDAAERLGLKKVEIPLNASKKHDLKAMRNAMNKETKLVYICNPNNPTGTVLDYEELVAFVQEVSKQALVLVDEAYIEFTNQPSLAPLTTTNKQLIVVKTFSKIYGLAGARIGYGIAHDATIEALGKLNSMNNGNMAATTIAAALASLQDNAFIEDVYQKNMSARNYTLTELEKLGISCIPSHTNFIYFSLKNYQKDYFALLKANNIIGTKIYEEKGQWSRITVGKMEEMQAFIKAIS